MFLDLRRKSCTHQDRRLGVTDDGDIVLADYVASRQLTQPVPLAHAMRRPQGGGDRT